MTGTVALKWLVNELDFKGIIISASGDSGMGKAHMDLGAKLAWNKPLPSFRQMRLDLLRAIGVESERDSLRL